MPTAAVTQEMLDLLLDLLLYGFLDPAPRGVQAKLLIESKNMRRRVS